MTNLSVQVLKKPQAITLPALCLAVFFSDMQS